MQVDRSLRLCVVLGEDAGDPDDRESRFAVAVASGATSVRMTIPGPAVSRSVSRAAALVERAHERGIALIVDEDTRAAIALGADGCHLAGPDHEARHSRLAVGQALVVGVTVSSVLEAVLAAAEGADYLEAGPVFEGTTPIGLEEFKAICGAVDPPVVAWGGIRPDRVAEVLRAGAVGVAVGDEVTQAEDMEYACLRLRAAVDQASALRV